MRDITLDSTIYIRFTTRAFATGIPTTLAGTPVLSVYEENNLTQITSGVSITVDYDSVTGLNQATIVATSGNGYESGKSYDLVVTTGTVDSVSVVGEVVGSFTVESGAAYSVVNSLGVTKNTAFSNYMFTMVLSSDHYTAATGLTVTGERSLDGGAFVAVSGTIAEISDGVYQFDALAADTNGDIITWKFSSGTADDTTVTFETRV